MIKFNQITRFISFGFFGIYLSSCATLDPGHQPPEASDPAIAMKAFDGAVSDAKSVENWEVTHSLAEISIDNPNLIWNFIDGQKYILVATWKAETSYYVPKEGSIFYNTGPYDIWVTLSPQLKEICRSRKFANSETKEARLEQLLGLKPESGYQSFVEFWVRPKDLFRPCPDPNTSNKSCGLNFPINVSTSHRDWIENQRATNDYPWTQLGYTYDWNGRSTNRMGLSEFVILQNTDVVIKDIKPTAEYCSK